LREIAVGVLADPWKRLSIESRIWRPSAPSRNKTRRIAQAVDAERMWKPFGVPSRLSAEATAAMIVRAAPPRA